MSNDFLIFLTLFSGYILPLEMYENSTLPQKRVFLSDPQPTSECTSNMLQTKGRQDARRDFWKTMISMPISTIKTYQVDVQWFLDISCTLFWQHLTTWNVWKFCSPAKTCVPFGPPTGIQMHTEHVAHQRAPRCKENSGKQWSQCQSQQSKHIKKILDISCTLFW